MINSCQLIRESINKFLSLLINHVTDFPLSSTLLLNFLCNQPGYWFFFVIVKLILLPYLLDIPFSFIKSFDINDNYILNNLPLWNWWKHLNILPLWQQWQRVTCYAIEDFLSFFFLTTPPVIIYPPEIVLPPLQLLKGNHSHILSNIQIFKSVVKLISGMINSFLQRSS